MALLPFRRLCSVDGTNQILLLDIWNKAITFDIPIDTCLVALCVKKPALRNASKKSYTASAEIFGFLAVNLDTNSSSDIWKYLYPLVLLVCWDSDVDWLTMWSSLIVITARSISLVDVVSCGIVKNLSPISYVLISHNAS